jgi:hypothetical protein
LSQTEKKNVGGGGGGGRDDLLNSIRKGKELNKTSEIPKVDKMSTTEQNNLANTIAMAMAARREAVNDSEDEEDEDDWEL